MDNYLYPEAIKKAGLAEFMSNVRISREVRNFIIENYAREAGVRSLKNYITRICEKVAFKVVDSPMPDSSTLIDVLQDDLEDFIGPAPFASRRIYDETPPGVVTGLAYNSIGGGILFIECTQAGFAREPSVTDGKSTPPLTKG